MTNVQEALKNTLVMLDALTVEFGITGLEPLIAEVKAALFEIEKCEPVGWYCEGQDGAKSIAMNPQTSNKYMQVTELFTSPQPRDWVDVTYEDRRELYKSVSKGNIDRFADLLSARLKQLNMKG